MTYDLIDISEAQGIIDWDKLTLGTECRQVCIRLGEGYHVDKHAARNWVEAKSHGWKRAAYHAFHAELRDIRQQADMLIETPDGDQPELFRAGDFELRYVTGSKLVNACKGYLDYLGAIEARPWCYTADWCWSRDMRYDNGTRPWWAADFKLWVADWWSTAYPILPRGWYRYELWQRGACEMGALPGISTRVDYNYYNPQQAPDAFKIAKALAVMHSLKGERLSL